MNKILKLPADLSNTKAPNLPEVCEKISYDLRGACLQFGKYDPANETFETCDEKDATHALVIIPKSLKQTLSRRHCGRKSPLEELDRRSDYSFDEKHSHQRFYAIIAYHNGEFQKGTSSKTFANDMANRILHSR